MEELLTTHGYKKDEKGYWWLYNRYCIVPLVNGQLHFSRYTAKHKRLLWSESLTPEQVDGFLIKGGYTLKPH